MAKVTPRPKWVLSSPKLVDAWSLQGGGRCPWGRGVRSHCLPVQHRRWDKCQCPPPWARGAAGAHEGQKQSCFSG